MPGMTTTLRDRLAESQERIRGLRTARAAARADVDRARARLDAARPSGNMTESDEFRAAEHAIAAADGIEEQLKLAKEEESYILHQIAGTSRDVYGDSFLRQPEALGTLAQAAESTQEIGRLRLGIGVAREDLLAEIGQGVGMMAAAGETTIGAAARTSYVGVARQLRRVPRLIDLFPSAPMDGSNSIEYTQEVGSFDTAAPVAEGASKPAATWDWPDAEATVRTLAHHTKMRKQQLADVPQLEAVVRDRLAYGVLRKLETQIISGDGTGENIKGIMAQTGIGSIAFDAGELAADQILEGLATVMLSEAEPNFVALNPRDWVDMLKAKATGDGQYFSGGPFVATAERLWNAVPVPSTGVTVGTALVGDATRGATVFVREGVSVQISDSDQDDFTRNRVTLLGEGRFTIAVWQPAAFAVVDLAA